MISTWISDSVNALLIYTTKYLVLQLVLLLDLLSELDLGLFKISVTPTVIVAEWDWVSIDVLLVFKFIWFYELWRS